MGCERCGNRLRLGKRFCSYECVNPSLEERFWSKVDIKSENECWLWLKGKNEFGYGKFNLGGRSGKTERAHRVSYMLLIENIPEKMHVLHHCDVPACVNPKHLYLGTDKENGRDRSVRNRLHVGINNPLAKFTKDLIDKIREEVKIGSIITKEMSEKYGVSVRHIRDIIKFKTRKKG